MKKSLSLCPVCKLRLKPFGFGWKKNGKRNNVQQVLRLLVNYQITEIWSKHGRWSKSILVKQKESVAHRKKNDEEIKYDNVKTMNCEIDTTQ